MAGSGYLSPQITNAILLVRAKCDYIPSHRLSCLQLQGHVVIGWISFPNQVVQCLRDTLSLRLAKVPSKRLLSGKYLYSCPGTEGSRMRQGFLIGLSQQHIEFPDEKLPFSRRSSVNYLLLELESYEMFDIASTSMELFVGD